MTSPNAKPIIIAVDGPAGSGKSSICSEIAERYGWTYVNTGALYRAVAVICRKLNINVHDQQKVANMIDDLADNIIWEQSRRKLYYKNEDITDALYSEQTGQAASVVAKLPIVRQKLLPLQRQLALQAPKVAIIDGRDIGTVVFPQAEVKIFLVASLTERAKRRLKQLQDDQVTLEEIMDDIESRDQQDQDRGHAPLKKADDAVVVDTSNMAVDGAVESVIRVIMDQGFDLFSKGS